MHIPQPCSRREHWHPPNDIYPPIVGRIYPIPIYKNSTDIYFPNCWQNISNTNEYKTGAQFAGARFAGAQFAAKGPNLPGPNLPGPNLPPSNFPGPNLPHPKFSGAQSARAQFAGAPFAGAQSAGAQFAAKKRLGPNLPRTHEQYSVFDITGYSTTRYHTSVSHEYLFCLINWLRAPAVNFSSLVDCVRLWKVQPRHRTILDKDSPASCRPSWP